MAKDSQVGYEQLNLRLIAFTDVAVHTELLYMRQSC